jgi:5'-methylthioadenosine phosphorylase
MGEVLVRCGNELDIPIVDGGTIVVIQGPRFSTRAESRWFAESGFDLVGMTQYPEAWLARELELCYANVSLVTDYDVGVKGGEPVSAGAVIDVFRENLDRLRALLFRAVPKIGPQPDDLCAIAMKSAIVHH